MTRNQFIHIIKNPYSLNPSDVKQLEELSTAFPYCQISHMLLAKAADNNGSMHTHTLLKRAAAYSSDRKHLKNLISYTVEIPENKFITEEIKPLEIPSEQAIETIKIDEVKPEEFTVPQPTESYADSIIEELQKTLEESRILREKNTHFSEIKIEKEVFKQEDISTKIVKEEVPIKVEEKVSKNEGFEEEKNHPSISDVVKSFLMDEFLGINLYSSRLGGIVQAKDELSFSIQVIEKEVKEEKKKTKSKQDIIDNFIQNAPKIKSPKETHWDGIHENLSERQLKKKNIPATETLAKLFAKQGKMKAAIETYEKLILKYPEKKTYFAAQIEKLK